MIRKIYNKLVKTLNPPPPKFDETGERVDITYSNLIDFGVLDMYQKSHFRRYQFAVDIIKQQEVCGDFACGTGYGSVMLAEKAQKVIGADLNEEVITAIKKRYSNVKHVEFVKANLLDINYDAVFDTIVSFETIEHFSEQNISLLLANFYKALKPKGRIIFSTPFMQERSEAALQLGHHLTFYINEEKISQWLTIAGFDIELYKYQNYETHTIHGTLEKKDFILCVATRN